MADKTVLISGGSGFIGAHVVVKALEKGYNVRTTVRSLGRADEVRQMIRSAGLSEAQAASIKFFEVDLLGDKGWDDACKDVDYFIHVASPYPATLPKNDDELIKPAREGTLRALQAAKRSKSIKRVVITSSFAAVGYGHEKRTAQNPFTEKDWTVIKDPKSPVGAYEKSKTLAEQAAWQWSKEEGQGLEIATVNPVSVWGPSIGKAVNTSLELPRRMLSGQMPGLPNLTFGIVDVRDVADLHLLALEAPNATGQRYLAVSDELAVSVKDISTYMKEGLTAHQSRKVPTLVLPDFLLHIGGHFDKSIAFIGPELGRIRPVSNAKAKEELGWKPRSAREAVLSSALSLIENGQVKV